ncbi:MAG: DUF4129 domain-containing protein [Limisphaerales bacterium]
MSSPKPVKTPADYMVIAISPVLIMLLVGSISFFLIQVFYRGEAVGSVRWVVFWFVLAVVLVSRIGIEQGTAQAAVYGLALAGATWIYLVQIHPAYLMGIILLGTVWWCAHKLTWDCTVIDEDEDASGSGLLQTAASGGRFKPEAAASASAGKKPVAGSECSVEPAARNRRTAPTLQNSHTAHKRRAAVPHPPGLWVVYFSLLALPLFGFGQMLLPGGDTESRRASFAFLFVYMAAGVGLLLTTSFLGLRRYLRQRYLKMPGIIAFGWLKFGAAVAGLVLAAAMLLPRPGVNDTWQTLRYHVDYQLHRASEYAARISPHGAGRGRPGDETQKSGEPKVNSSVPQSQTGKPQPANNGQQNQTPNQNEATPNQTAPPQPANSIITGSAAGFYRWFRALFLLAGAILTIWWVVRQRDLILQIARSFLAALAQFFRDLFQLGSRVKRTAVKRDERTPGQHPFAAYRSPFLTGKDKSWTAEELILYSYEALQAWAVEQGIQSQPQQTAREFCLGLGETFPDAAAELNRLSFLYGHAAYGNAVPPGCDLEPVRKLWRYLSSPDIPR